MNKVRSIWNNGGQAIAGWLQMPGALHAEALARCGYDAVVVDLQHSTIDFETALTMLTAIELGGAEPIVRLKWNEPSDTMKLLDGGAYGVIAPMIDTAAQARTFAGALHYPQRGERSFGPRRPALRYGAGYAAIASDTLIALAMIETRQALTNLDAILNVDGLDGVFIGPTDLSLSLGFAPKPDSSEPDVVAAIAEVRRRAHAAGKRVGIFCAGGDFARAKLAEGFDLVTLTPDLAMITEAAKTVLAKARAAG